jgi:hypothetical protein
MIKHEGDQFCLYTQDGSRKIACHPTRQAAEAQEAAIRSRQAQNEALRGRAVQIALADIPTFAAGAETLPNGDVLKWIPLADAGEKWVNGPQEFDMTPGLIDQGIANWKKDGANPLVVTIGHTFDAAAPAAAWIENLERRSDGRPWGLVHFLADTWSRIEKGEFKYFSLEFYKATVDRKGEDIGFAFDGGAILNKPFFAIRLDQEKHGGAAPCFALSRFTNDAPAPAPPSPEPAAPTAAAPPTALQQGDNPMPDPNTTPNPAPAAPVVTGDKVTLSKAQFDSLISLQSENAQLKVKNEELKAKETSNDARISQLERKSAADRLRSAVKTLQRDHGVVLQLGDFAIDSSDADALAWLATQPYGVSTVEGLEKLARDTEATSHLPRVKLGGERSGGGNPDLKIPVDLSTKAGRLEAIRRGVSQLRRETAKDELDFMLARRKQSPEAFVAEELANANPQFRKEIQAESSSAA